MADDALPLKPTGEELERAVSIHCQPGSLVALHPKLLHGGSINRSAYPRRNIILQIGRADSPLVTEAKESITGRMLT